MEILVAVIAFAGALLAAIAMVSLVRRLREEAEGWLIAWVVAAAALSVALGVIGMGHLVGFGALTFKIYQLAGSLLGPLWLAIGLIQLLAEKVPPKFAAWLFGVAFTIISGVILIVDPLLSEQMGKVLPSPGQHWGLIPDTLLVAAHAIVALILLGAVVVAALRWRSGDEYDTDNLHAVLVIAPSVMAILGAMRFAVPGFFTAALLVVAAAAIWYCALRPLAPYEDEEDEDEPDLRHAMRDGARNGGQAGAEARYGASDGRQGAHARRAAPDDWAARSGPPSSPRLEPVSSAELPPGQPQRRTSGLGDLVAEYRAGDREVDYAARMTPPPDSGPSTGYIMNGRHGAPPDDYGVPRQGQDRGQDSGLQSGAGLPGGPGLPGGSGLPGGAGLPGGSGLPGAAGVPGNSALPGVPGGSGVQGGVGQPGDYAGSRTDRQDFGPATGALYTAGADLFSPGAQRPQPQPAPPPQPASGRPSPSIYGILTVFTLMDGSGEAFDRLAEQTVEAVRRGEPDTLVFACHGVKSAPLQRIVYEIYRDEVAYRDHQRQPHVERFITERQPMVLATNVIELNVNAAKVVPLPTALF